MALKLHKSAVHRHHGEKQDSTKMLREHHKKILWVYWTLFGLGVWLLTVVVLAISEPFQRAKRTG